MTMIKAAPLASKRTKSRIAERGPWFEIEETRVNIDGIGTGVLLRQVGGDWFGWLPVDEVDICE